MNGFIQGTLSDNNGIHHLNVFNKYTVNDKKYHVVKFSLKDYNSSMQIDSSSTQKEILSDKCK